MLQVLLVTGGFDGLENLVSTETLQVMLLIIMVMMMETLQDGGSQWVEAGPLPTPTYGLAVVTLGNKLLATGEPNDKYQYM